MLRFAWEFLLLGECGKAIGSERKMLFRYAGALDAFAAAYQSANIFALDRFALQ